MKYRCALGAAGWALVAAAALGQDYSLNENVVWASTARDPALPDSVELGVEPIDGEDPDDMVVLLHRLGFSLSESNVTLSRVRAYRFDSAEAIRDFGNIRTSYDAAKDQVTIRHAVVVDADGDIHTIDPATVQVLPGDSFNVFSDTMIVVMPLAGLDVGATAVVVDTIESSRDTDIGPWGVVINQQYGVPIRKMEIAVDWDSPERRPTWNSGLESMSCSETDPRRLSCAASDIPAYPVDEDAYYDDIVPQFVVAEELGWPEIRDWYRPLFESALSSDDSIEALASRLVDGLETEADMLRAIHRFVATEIRYVAFEHGDSAYVPHSTATTLARRYGDCKDKAALLVDLLAQVDIDMFPVLVSTTRRSTDNLVVPTKRYFDHLIVCGTLTDGRSYCLDATDPYTGIEPLSGWIQGAVSLPITDGGELSRLPEERYGWIISENFELSLDESGTVVERGDVEYAGIYGTGIRQGLAGMNGSELQQWAVNDYHSAVSDLVDPVFEFSGIDDIDRNVTASWQVAYERLVQSTEDLEYADVMPWLNQALRSLETQNDTYNYRFPGLRFESTLSFDVADAWSIESVGPMIDMRSRFGEFRREYEVRGQTVDVRTQFTAPAAVIGPGSVDEFNRFLDIVRDEGMFRVRGQLRANE